MAIETIRISKRGRDHLVKLKRLTRIPNWNIICRWAFCSSIADPTPPRHQRIPADSPVEMTWRTFGGEYAALYLALLKERCKQDGIELTESAMATQFRLHLHRGIAHLAGDVNIRNVRGLIAKALPEGTKGE